MKNLVYTMQAILLGVILLTSCESDKIYDGPAQIAFATKTTSFTVDKDMEIFIPVQLIANAPQKDISANIAVNASSTCSGAVNVPASVTISGGRFEGSIKVNVSYDKLAAGNANKLVLDLSATDVKVAANYATLTVTITKK